MIGRSISFIEIQHTRFIITLHFKAEYWIDDTRLGCNLEQIDNHILEYVNVLEGQLLDLKLDDERCLVSSQLMLQELEEKQSDFTHADRLDAALIILSKMSRSQNVSSTFRSRYE